MVSVLSEVRRRWPGRQSARVLKALGITAVVFATIGAGKAKEPNRFYGSLMTYTVAGGYLSANPPATEERLEADLRQLGFTGGKGNWTLQDDEGSLAVRGSAEEKLLVIVYMPARRPAIPAAVLDALLAKASGVGISGPNGLSYQFPAESPRGKSGEPRSTVSEAVSVGMDGGWLSTSRSINW
jgi:hypothetical protein